MKFEILFIGLQVVELLEIVINLIQFSENLKLIINYLIEFFSVVNFHQFVNI